jgi:hypothetical protein
MHYCTAPSYLFVFVFLLLFREGVITGSGIGGVALPSIAVSVLTCSAEASELVFVEVELTSRFCSLLTDVLFCVTAVAAVMLEVAVGAGVGGAIAGVDCGTQRRTSVLDN